MAREARRSGPRYFVTATDTGVGKTQVACALLSLMAEAGLAPVPFKPYESGVDARVGPSDAQALLAASRSERMLEQVCLHRYAAPVAPGVAAVRRGERSTWPRTLAALKGLGEGAAVIEGAGGLLVPLDARHDVIDLVEVAALPVVLVARASLGTLNHVGLSLLALAARGITTRAVVLVQGVPGRDPSVRDNASWIARRHGAEVLGPVPFRADPAARARAFRKVLAPLVP